MKKKFSLTIFFLICFFLCRVFIPAEAAVSITRFLFPFPVLAKISGVRSPAAQGWKAVESKYCTILYHPDVNIEEANDRLKLKFYDISLGRKSYSSGKTDAEQQLAEKFDRLFCKVKEILDMYPNRIHLTIKIYKNQAQLDNAYFETFGFSNKEQRISYYIHKYTTVYTTQEVISQEVMAHEIGHAVIDHYFLILPPEKIKELLAQYVEMHLGD